MKILSAVFSIILLGLLVFGSLGLPLIGDKDSPAAEHVSPRYIEKAYKETGSPNLVTAVLADYRSFDTLGETTVIFIAGAATILILRTTAGRKDAEGGSDE